LSILASQPRETHADEPMQAALSAATDKELATLREGLVEGFKKRDIGAMLEFVTPDVVVTWQNGEVSHGKEELRKYIDRMLSGPDSVVSEVDGAPTVEGRKIYDNQIISYGHMNDSFVLRTTKQKLTFDSRFSALIVRDNGRLLLSGLHLSVNAFDNSIMSAAVGFFKMLAIFGSIGALLVGAAIGRFLLGRKGSCC